MTISPENDTRTHCYVMRCEQCPSLAEVCDRGPLKASRLARRHARRYRGHRAYVLNLTRLERVETVRYPVQIGLDDTPPF